MPVVSVQESLLNGLVDRMSISPFPSVMMVLLLQAQLWAQAYPASAYYKQYIEKFIIVLKQDHHKIKAQSEQNVCRIKKICRFGRLKPYRSCCLGRSR